MLLGKLIIQAVHFAASECCQTGIGYNALQVVPAGYDFVSVLDAVRPLIEVEQSGRSLVQFAKSPKIAGTVRLTAQRYAEAAAVNLTIVGTLTAQHVLGCSGLRCSRHAHFLKPTEVARQEGCRGTDDSSLVERLGLTVLCVESQRKREGHVPV